MSKSFCIEQLATVVDKKKEQYTDTETNISLLFNLIRLQKLPTQLANQKVRVVSFVYYDILIIISIINISILKVFPRESHLTLKVRKTEYLSVREANTKPNQVVLVPKPIPIKCISFSSRVLQYCASTGRLTCFTLMLSNILSLHGSIRRLRESSEAEKVLVTVSVYCVCHLCFCLR